jgi:hypothetical protein
MYIHVDGNMCQGKQKPFYLHARPGDQIVRIFAQCGIFYFGQF